MAHTTLAMGAPAGLLDRARIVAGPGFNRWLVPPAALAIHLCIGMAYGFSVFWLPLSQAIGIAGPKACPPEFGLLDALFATSCDWKVADLGWMYTLFFLITHKPQLTSGACMASAGSARRPSKGEAPWRRDRIAG